MSVFSESIYAQNEQIEGKTIEVEGIIDDELGEITSALNNMKIQNKNGTIKIKKMNHLQAQTNEFIPKKIEIVKLKSAHLIKMKAFNTYINCIAGKEEEECRDIKEELDKLNIGTNLLNSNPNEFGITNPYVVKKIRQCSQITQDSFPGFRAAIEIDFTIDEKGQAISAYINEDESEISHDLTMFSKCIEHFALKLNFKNDTGKPVSFKKNFIFG